MGDGGIILPIVTKGKNIGGTTKLGLSDTWRQLTVVKSLFIVSKFSKDPLEGKGYSTVGIWPPYLALKSNIWPRDRSVPEWIDDLSVDDHPDDP